MNATGSVLVDTNVVVAYFRGEKALAPRFAEAATLYLPWVVLGELHGQLKAELAGIGKPIPDNDLWVAWQPGTGTSHPFPG